MGVFMNKLEELKILKQKRAEALKNYDFKQLSLLNEKIFNIRQQLKSEKLKELQAQKDEKFAHFVENVCEFSL